MEGEDFFSTSEDAGKVAPSICMQNRLPTQKKKKNKDTRRFSDDQIRSLESIFKMETKLEPKKKLQLARELGLQPRQVAIWFQNRRARWKSKQIEQEYRALKANYDNLKSQFESLNEEKESLLTQLQKLNDLLKEPIVGDKALEGRSMERGLDNNGMSSELKAKPNSLIEGSDQGLIRHSNEDEGKNPGYLAQDEEPEFLNLCEQQINGSLTLTQKWSSFDSGGILEHSCGTCSNWSDFWI